MAERSEPSSNSKWMTYLSDNALLDVEDPASVAPFFWQGVENAECSPEVNARKTDSHGDSGPQKKSRGECMATGKANREKMRRDRLNDRFMELSQILDPERQPKIDKTAILIDAVKVIGQLRNESLQLVEGNSHLKDQIKELKNEKNELRNEKARLKAEKEKLELQVKAMSMQGAYMSHPAAMQAAAVAAFTAQAQAQAHAVSAVNMSKAAGAMPSYNGMPPMWQWLPPSTVDTSQDHIRHPPMA